MIVKPLIFREGISVPKYNKKNNTYPLKLLDNVQWAPKLFKVPISFPNNKAKGIIVLRNITTF
jgi:hypothetical protein